jgi:hypothetical protein
MAGSEDREATEAEWLKRLQEAAAAKETLVEYTRRRGLRVGEAYRWKQHLLSISVFFGQNFSNLWPLGRVGPV